MMKIKYTQEVIQFLRSSGNLWQDEDLNEWFMFPRTVFKIEDDCLIPLDVKEIPEFILKDLIK